MAVTFAAIFLLLVATVQILPTNSIDVGVCYGTLGNNLPPPADVIKLYKKYGVSKLRLFDPNHAALDALRKSGISVILGVRNEDLRKIAASQEAANSWFATNMAPYHDVQFSIVAAGNEVIPGEFAESVLPAMTHLNNVIKSKGLSSVRVSTVIHGETLSTSYPPSAGAFSPKAAGILNSGLLKFLSAQRSPLLVNMYPYFAYASDPATIRLDYAQFTAEKAVVTDGELKYYNLLVAMVDAFHSAIAKAGVSNLDIIVSETGWPSAGNGNLTTPALASTYNKNFLKHITSNKGTPKKPGGHLEGYIFAMFNENQKSAGVEQNWGLFYPNQQPVYHVFTT